MKEGREKKKEGRERKEGSTYKVVLVIFVLPGYTYNYTTNSQEN